MSLQPKKKRTKKRLTPKKTFAIFFVVTLLACIVVFTSGLGIFATILDQRPMAKDPDNIERPRELTEEKMDILFPAEGMFAAEFADSKRVNILLMGTTDEGLADTIMLASFDPETQAADIISVPRDTYYERPGASGANLKINSVAHQGPEELARAVHNVLLGIPINYYAVLDYKGVANIVDSIGGVPMNVPIRMRYSSPPQNLYIDLQPGEQILDGDKAVQYLRFRSGYRNGDIGRVEAQQAFVKNAVKQAMGLQLPKVAKTVIENVNSDITNRAILYLAGQAVDLDASKVRSFLLPGTAQSIKGGSFWVRKDDTEIATMLREVYVIPDPVTTEGAITGGAVSESEGKDTSE
jgi:LCP family protein required for cell wall assembly